MECEKKRSRPVSRVLSRTAIHLGCTSPRTSSDLPGNRAGRAIVPLFGLAPDGVCPATGVATGAVRSYRTISPLPALTRLGGVFSVALSVGSRRPGVTWHPALWSPDFPPGIKFPAAVRPTPKTSIRVTSAEWRVKPASPLETQCIHSTSIFDDNLQSGFKRRRQKPAKTRCQLHLATRDSSLVTFLS